MRNAIIGGFLGVMMAAAVLAACGGSGGGGTNATTEQLTQQVEQLQAEMTTTQARVGAQESLLSSFSTGVDGALMVTSQSMIIEGGNLYVRNGAGATDTSNGLGNVIIGYQEPRVTGGDVRTGSHMLVVGMKNNYSTFGGIVVGSGCQTSGDWASVCGGVGNTASGQWSLVSGGYLNTAAGTGAQVSGGTRNTASGPDAQVSGGESNTAGHTRTQVSGSVNQATTGANQVLP